MKSVASLVLLLTLAPAPAAAIDLADNWIQITRLELFVWTTNSNAVRLYKSLGFEQEGTLRDYAFYDGRFLDAYVMARFRPAWDN